MTNRPVPVHTSQPNPNIHTQPKTSGFAIASLVCGILGCLFLPALLGIVFGIIAIQQINRSGGTLKGSGLAIGGLVASGVFLVLGLLASMLLPALAKAKTRANRIKCVSNIKQVGGSLKAFANDNNNRYPWLLQPADEAAQGGGVTGWSIETATLFAQSAIKSNLASAKILVSPLDPDNQGVNDGIDLANVDITAPVDNGGHSYGVVNGAGGSGMAADDSRPGTILTVTRNISGPANSEDSLSDQGDTPPVTSASGFATWKGADKHPVDDRTMESLNANAGQLGLSDGSAYQSNDADLGQKTKAHHGELGGNYRGSPSGFLDTPND